MKRNSIPVQLTPEERFLILRYGYPFAKIEQALKLHEGSQQIETVPLDRYELEQLVGDLCRTINELNRGALEDKLLDLRDRLEAAERYGDGQLDTF